MHKFHIEDNSICSSSYLWNFFKLRLWTHSFNQIMHTFLDSCWLIFIKLSILPREKGSVFLLSIQIYNRTQDPQYSKIAVLKIRCFKKPQFLKYDCCEKNVWKKKFRQLPKLSTKSSFKNVILPLYSSWYTPQKRDNGFKKFTRCGLLSFFKSPKKF